jgi:hypothetical protein
VASNHYNQDPDLDQEQYGEEVEAPDIGTLAVLNKSEIDQQITTARAYPRSIKKFRNEALQLATLDEETAQECIYALPRKERGEVKTIEGPSARFAEIINYAWGNTRAGARSIGEDGDFVKSQGLFYDLEKNTAISYEVSRRIVNRDGKKFNADMIGTTSNAAASIALRNAILKGIPKALWKPIYMAARSVVAGDIRTLANRRGEAVKQFAIFGVNPEMIFNTLGVKGIEDVTIDHLVTLKGILTAIQEGDTTPEQAFASGKPELPTDIKRKSESANGQTPQNGSTVQTSVMPSASSAQEVAKAGSDPTRAGEIPSTALPPQEQSQVSTRPTEPTGDRPQGLQGVFGSDSKRGQRRHRDEG